MGSNTMYSHSKEIQHNILQTYIHAHIAFLTIQIPNVGWHLHQHKYGSKIRRTGIPVNIIPKSIFFQCKKQSLIKYGCYTIFSS